MASKAAKKKVSRASYSPLEDIGAAGRVARDPGSFTGTGTRPRVMKAQAKVRELVSKGYRLNSKANTSSTYRDAVAEAGSPRGRLKKLLSGPW